MLALSALLDVGSASLVRGHCVCFCTKTDGLFSRRLLPISLTSKQIVYIIFSRIRPTVARDMQ